VDEFRTALELATDEELQDLTDILFRRGMNPLDYINMPTPLDVQSYDRDGWITAIEERFRFLAADGMSTLTRRTHEVTYRDVLIQVCRYLKLPYKASMSTIDLEAEVFLNVLGRAWKQLPPDEQNALTVRLKRSLTKSQVLPELPAALQHNPMGLVMKGGTALAVTSVVRPILMGHIARQLAIQIARYQATRQAIALGGTAAAQIQHAVGLHLARQGMALTAARYTAVRTVFACLGPALWAWFFADLGWRAVSTNYSRVIPIIYALAQIRLTRTACFEPA
jgi:uncharacterized protein YaaW (UPF0174 family)